MKKICVIGVVMLVLILLLCGCDGGDALSGSDVPEIEEPPVVWEQAADEGTYLAMMNEKLSEYIGYMTSISAMERRLCAFGEEEKIAADEQYSALAEQLADWCEGARSYPAETLINERAQSVCLQMTELAGVTEDYLELLPSMLAGCYEGELTLADYQNSIADSVVAVYELLNSSENNEE